MRHLLIAALATFTLASGCKSEAQTQAEARAAAATALPFSKSAGTLTGTTVQTDASRYRMRITSLAIVAVQ